MVLGWMLVFLSLAVSGAAAGVPRLEPRGGRVRLTGLPLILEWNAQAGRLEKLVDAKTGANLVDGAERPFDLHTRNGWVFQRAQMHFAGIHLGAASAAAGPAMVRVVLAWAGRGWKATETWDLARSRAFAVRNVEMHAGPAAGTAEFDESRLILGTLAPIPGPPRIAAPWVWPPAEPTVPEFAENHGNIALACATSVPGMVSAPLPGGRAAAFGQYWRRDWNIWLARGLDGKRVRLESKYLCRGRIHPNLTIPFGGQFVFVVPGDHEAGLRALGDAWTILGFRHPAWPAWVRERGLALYSLSAKGSMGSWGRDLLGPEGRHGLQNFLRLQYPGVQRLGIDAIWFLPLWPGGYGVSDYWRMDPAAGTPEDLGRACALAHAGGVRILCDLIPHGPRASSGLARQHPDFIARDRRGRNLEWWGCLACDYAHPGWQEYMARVAEFWVKKCNIDGYRVDVAGGGRSNWRPHDDFLPSWSGEWGGLELMHRVRTRLERVKPGCLLLGECADPPMLGEAHCIYDWPFERLLYAFPDTPRGQWVRWTRRWLERQFLSTPNDAVNGFMRFTENHDQIHSVWKLGPDVARAIWSLCAFCHGFPLLYHGQEVGFEDLWAQMLNLRRQLPECRLGAADYTGVVCSQPFVLAFARRAGNAASLIAVNFSSTPCRTRLAWSGAPSGLKWARAFPEGVTTPLPSRGSKGRIALETSLRPWGWRLIALRRSRAALARLRTPQRLPPAPVSPEPPRPAPVSVRLRIRTPDGRRIERLLGRQAGPAPTRWDQETGALLDVTVRRGPLALTWANGLLCGLRMGKTPLLGGCELREGRERLFTGPQLFRLAVYAGAPRPPPVPGTRWSVTRLDGGGVELAWRQNAGPARFEARWRLDREARLTADLVLTPHSPTGPVLGRLVAAFAGPPATGPGAPPLRWQVHTIEGGLGGPFSVRHPTAREWTGRYRHPIQRLWEDALLPLDPARPEIAWETGGHRLSFLLPPAAAAAAPADNTGPVNAWLFEYRPDAVPGITFYVAAAEPRAPRAFGPKHPFHLRLRLLLDRIPRRTPPQRPVAFHCEGADWTVQNAHYRAHIRRSAGGNLRGLAPARPGAAPVIRASETYTDAGLLGFHTDPKGRSRRVVGTNANDFEPDCSIASSPHRLLLRFSGCMRRRGDERNRTQPRIDYSTEWSFTSGPYITVRHTVQPLIAPRKDGKAFLAHILTVPDLLAWRIESGNRSRSGKPATDPRDRVWQAPNPGPQTGKLRILLETRRGTAEISEIRSGAPELQNLFLAHDGRRYVLFFAFLDRLPGRLDARPSSLSYRLRLLPGGPPP